jgi:hypothetical protein
MPRYTGSRVKGMARLLALLLVGLTTLAACSAGTDASQVKAVIEKSNHEQEDAFAARDPGIMEDAFTARAFAYMVRTNELLEQEGAVGIRLSQLEWVDVQVDSSSTAQATTFETWEQTDQDGNTYSSRDHNVYRLIKIGDSWKIDELTYPDKDQQPSPDSTIPTPSPPGP